jgi:hypothetical protein
VFDPSSFPVRESCDVMKWCVGEVRRGVVTETRSPIVFSADAVGVHLFAPPQSVASLGRWLYPVRNPHRVKRAVEGGGEATTHFVAASRSRNTTNRINPRKSGTRPVVLSRRSRLGTQPIDSPPSITLLPARKRLPARPHPESRPGESRAESREGAA